MSLDLELAVFEAARTKVGEAALATGALSRAILDRSHRYTTSRDRLTQASDPRGDLAARATFFTITDALKLAIPLAELAHRDAIPGRPAGLRVVDLGAGCGAMSLGLVAALDGRFDILAIDRDRDALDIAAHAIDALAKRRDISVTFTPRHGDVSTSQLPPSDLTLIGSVLNELAAEPALALIERALSLVASDGAVIIIEPALRETTRALHAIRDAVITRGWAHVFAPCTRRIAPCPALADARDWCHEHRHLALPPRTAELARKTHLRDSGLRFSYLVLRPMPLDLVEHGDAAWRVVSHPIAAKGKLEVIGCSAQGRVPLRRLRRHRAAKNVEFDSTCRGDILVLEDSEAGPSRIEISSATTARRIKTPPG